ncbi:MAG TPA: hypothetical protein VF147_09405, partial [Vicinamibacterales bacterium]
MAEEKGISRFKLPWSGPAQRVARREAAAPGDWRQTLRTRVLVCAGVFALWTVGIEARLVYLQVIAHADMMARADKQQLRTIKPPAKRGEILDRNGHVLAYSVDADTVAADPSEVPDAADAAARICA